MPGGRAKLMKRRESREKAFALLFEWSFQGGPLDEMIENASQARDLEIDGFALDLTRRAIDSCEEIDELIKRYSEKWKINRLSRVTLSALRLSICEMSRFDDIPVGATINEAVELVKKFGTEDEAAYVNGILGSYARKEKEGGAELRSGDEDLSTAAPQLISEPGELRNDPEEDNSMEEPAEVPPPMEDTP